MPTAASVWVADVGEEEEAGPYGRKPFIPDFGHPRGSTDWMRDAACVGPSSALFVSDSSRDRDEAKRICMSCPVIVDCADHKDRIGNARGVWAGGKAARQYVASSRAQADADRQAAAKAEPAEHRLRLVRRPTSAPTYGSAQPASRPGKPTCDQSERCQRVPVAVA